MKNINKIDNHICGGYKEWTSCGYEYNCDYQTDIPCDDCVFVVSEQTGDKRKGKRPWAECNKLR